MESTGLPGPDTYLLPSAASFSAEASPFDPASDNDQLTGKMVELALRGRNNAQAWLLQTRALEGAGYLPGDIVITDSSASFRAGDAVAAQVVDARSGTAETVFRLIEPPYLISLSHEMQFRKPVLIDNDRVIVIGAITQSFRGRRN